MTHIYKNKELKIYESERISFRIIDSIGFEPGLIKQQQAINAVKKMVHHSFANQKQRKNLRMVIPVVASIYVLNDSAYVAPEGVQAAEKDISAFKRNRKRVLSQSIAGVSTAAGVVAGAVPIPVPDAALLTPIEIAEINALAQVYGIHKGEECKKFFDSIVEIGTVSVVAKAVINARKAIPGIGLAASVVNAIIAGCFVAAIAG